MRRSLGKKLGCRALRRWQRALCFYGLHPAPAAGCGGERMSLNQPMPFGKHKGLPIALLVADSNYCAWLLDQDWFRDRFPELNALIDGAQKQGAGDQPSVW